MSNIDVIIKFWKIARISSCGTKKYRQTSLMKKVNIERWAKTT